MKSGLSLRVTKKIPKQELALAKKLKNEYFDLKGGYHEKG
jgi:hypothetical protein